jgi:uncharacterized protein with GYD domain
MGTYITLVNWTEQGIHNYPDTVKRQAAARDLAERFGAKDPQFFWTMGAYDAVGVVQFPDDESATAFALALSSQGNVRTTTMRAFAPDEMTRVVDKAVGAVRSRRSTRAAPAKRASKTKKAARAR